MKPRLKFYGQKQGTAMGEDIEITEIKQFLAEIVPFNSLSDKALSKAARGIRISYFSSQSGHVEIDYDNPQLYLVRTGGFEVRDKQGNLLDRLAEGECFGYPSLLTGQNVNNKVTVLEDGLVYLLDLELFKNLRDDSAEFDRFFNRAHAKRMKRFSEPSSQDQAITQTVGSLLKNHQVIIDHGPVSRPTGRGIYFYDPDGFIVEIRCDNIS